MVALAKAKNIPYAIDHNHRFTPAARKAKEWLDEGRLGELNSINMRMWINNPNESSEHFHIRALHPHSFDVMRFFCGKVSQVHAFFKKGAGRAIWSNVQVNLLYENGVIGHLLGSYDGGGPGTPWGLETCEIVGQEARIIIEEACEVLKFQPRHSIESETYHHLGGMKDFSETFQSRIDQWIEDLSNGVPPDRIDGKSDDSLHAQQIIEAAIESWSAKSVISL
jgi:predicted dehydrogenase